MAQHHHTDPLYTAGITLTAVRVFEQLSYLNQHARSQQQRLHPALHPTRRWLAARCHASVATISRATTRLAQAGHLRKEQTKGHDGQWRPTWYWLAAGAADRVRFAVARSLRHPRRVTSSSHITKNFYNSPEEPNSRGGSRFRTSLITWLSEIRAGTAAGKIYTHEPPAAGLSGRPE